MSDNVYISEIPVEVNAESLALLISSSFKTVADEFGLTRENAPTNPAFITAKSIIKSSIDKEIDFFGLFCSKQLVGCCALENAGSSIFYLERLAVAHDFRHLGFGRKLVNYCLEKADEQNGKKISIGIINENKVLKHWYSNLGFIETGIKTFTHLPFTVCFMEYIIQS